MFNSIGTTPTSVMNTIWNTPTGQKLMQNAADRGVNIQFLPDNGDNVKGLFDPTSNTITVENGTQEEMVETLAHELVHAATPENGNSLNEEYMAFVTGEKVAQEAGINFNPHGNDFWAQHVGSAYGNDGLPNDNGIAGSLANLGIGSPSGIGSGSIFGPGMGGLDQIAGLGGTGSFASASAAKGGGGLNGVMNDVGGFLNTLA